MRKTSPYFKTREENEEEPTPKKRCCISPLPTASLPSYSLSATSKIRLGEEFFNQESPAQEKAKALARAILGKVLVRCVDNKTELICGRIVETEAYLGPMDKACHTSNNKRTERTEPMFMKPGTVYVYSIYGMYHCLNISVGEGAAVLLRAVEPLSGLQLMQQLRSRRQKIERAFLPHQLCNGPSKLCLSYDITKELNKSDMTTISSKIWVEDWIPQPTFSTIASTRIGLSKKAGEWIDAPLRFYIMGSKSVSVIDRSKETNMRK